MGLELILGNKEKYDEVYRLSVKRLEVNSSR